MWRLLVLALCCSWVVRKVQARVLMDLEAPVSNVRTLQQVCPIRYVQ
jgi:hypothetical protein